MDVGSSLNDHRFGFVQRRLICAADESAGSTFGAPPEGDASSSAKDDGSNTLSPQGSARAPSSPTATISFFMTLDSNIESVSAAQQQTLLLSLASYLRVPTYSLSVVAEKVDGQPIKLAIKVRPQNADPVLEAVRALTTASASIIIGADIVRISTIDFDPPTVAAQFSAMSLADEFRENPALVVFLMTSTVFLFVCFVFFLVGALRKACYTQNDAPKKYNNAQVVPGIALNAPQIVPGIAMNAQHHTSTAVARHVMAQSAQMHPRTRIAPVLHVSPSGIRNAIVAAISPSKGDKSVRWQCLERSKSGHAIDDKSPPRNTSPPQPLTSTQSLWKKASSVYLNDDDDDRNGES